jgi:hypothetical protein
MARTLAGYLDHTAHQVFHARDLGFNNKPDIEWIEHLSATGEDWLIFTSDGRIRKNAAEREAYRRAKLKGVVLAPPFEKNQMGKCCGIIVAKWDDMVDFTSKIAAPYLVEMSISLSPKMKVLLI